ncbi:MAG: hypothetical protein PHG66_04395 [Candidatus Colwellbacteria bacterium]|nr:hypothetical protein [Candidatus Colwellbacteria bacterium]
MSFRIKNCISARSDNTSVAGLVKSHNHKFKTDHVKDDSKRGSDAEIIDRISCIEKSQCEIVTHANIPHKPCIIHEYISDRIKTLEDKVLNILDQPVETDIIKKIVGDSTISINDRLSAIESRSPHSVPKSVIDRITLLEKYSHEQCESNPDNISDIVEIPKPVIDIISSLEYKLSKSVDKLSSDMDKVFETFVGLESKSVVPKPSLENSKSIINRISALESKSPSPIEIPKSVLNRISALESKHLPVFEVPKSVLDRISSLESKPIVSSSVEVPKSVLDRISSLESKPIVSSSVEVPKSVLDRISAIENRRPDDSLTERILSLEKSSVTRVINDRISTIETKINKSDVTKLLADRIAVLENRKIKMEVPKSISDRLIAIETKEDPVIPDVKPIEKRLSSLEEQKIEIPQDLLLLVKTLSDRISSLESDAVKLKSKVESLSDEEFTSVHSPSSTNSNSLVHIK